MVHDAESAVARTTRRRVDGRHAADGYDGRRGSHVRLVGFSGIRHGVSLSSLQKIEPTTDECRRSQRVLADSQWASQLNAQESQFLRGTGNITQAGDFNPSTTRFWLALSPDHSYQLLLAYLLEELGQENVSANPERCAIQVVKMAGAKSVEGTFVMRASESLAMDTEGGEGQGQAQQQTMVNMRRARGSILHWRSFWWTVVRDQRIEGYVIRGDT